jgi:hypothetical protein
LSKCRIVLPRPARGLVERLAASQDAAWLTLDLEADPPATSNHVTDDWDGVQVATDRLAWPELDILS